jgi:hypothetical protein
VKADSHLGVRDLLVPTKIIVNLDAEQDRGSVPLVRPHVQINTNVLDIARMEKKIVLINKMNYLMLLNTVAFIILMVQSIIYTGTEHNLNGCLYDIDQVWCYNNLNCNYDAS